LSRYLRTYIRMRHAFNQSRPSLCNFFLQLITPSGLELRGEAGAADEINGISDIQNP